MSNNIDYSLALATPLWVFLRCRAIVRDLGNSGQTLDRLMWRWIFTCTHCLGGELHKALYVLPEATPLFLTVE